MAGYQYLESTTSVGSLSSSGCRSLEQYHFIDARGDEELTMNGVQKHPLYMTKDGCPHIYASSMEDALCKDTQKHPTDFFRWIL